jgi:hypothetical protein
MSHQYRPIYHAELKKGLRVGCDGITGVTVGNIIDWKDGEIRVKEAFISHPLDLEPADRVKGMESTWPAHRVAPVQNFHPTRQTWVPVKWKDASNA